MNQIGNCERLPSRVVHVIGDGRAGGGTTVVLTLSSLLAKRGIAVTIVSQQDSFLTDEATRLGLETLGLDFSHRSSAPKLAFQLRTYLARNPVDLVHCHGARAGLPALIAQRIGSTKRVYTVHGFHFRSKRGLWRELARRTEQFCMSRAEATVFVSRSDREVAREEGLLEKAKSSEVIYNGVELPSLKKERPKAFDIGFLGRLHPVKNPVILVDILTAMRPARPTLCVIGSGELEGELRRQIIKAGISDQVTFYGERPRHEALEFLAQCRTLALPSLSEGHPLAPIEAMLLDVPVVASDIPSTREIIDDGHNGFLVALPGIPVFAQRFTRLLGDESLRQSIAAEARRRAQTAFSIDEHFERYLRLYARLIGPPAAPGFAKEGRTSERA